MTVNVGTMELPVTEDADPVRTYLNGTHPSGGLWTALTRASNHDHSGGTNGIQLTATSIPDGSITTAKLDPAVLGPYALTDGSKPFTGTVTMDADALVRDTLRFGAKPAGVADATLARTGAGALRVDTHLGVGVNPAAWHVEYRTVQAGLGGALYAHTVSPQVGLAANTRYDASNQAVAVAAGQGARLLLGQDGRLYFDTAVNAAAGAVQTFTQRLKVDQTGTLTLTPDAGTAALLVSGPILAPPGTNVTLQSQGASNIQFNAAGGFVHPFTDGTIASGAPSAKWSVVYAAAGAINTSQAQAKEGITPLDPLACYQATKDVRWYEFVFRPPAYTEPEPPPGIAYDASDDNETKAEKKTRRDETEAQAKAAHLKMVVETAPARHQRGFVFPAGAESKDEAGGTLPPVPELFGLSDRESTTPGADVATLGCALQEVIRRLEALEEATA